MMRCVGVAEVWPVSASALAAAIGGLVSLQAGADC